MNQPRQNINSVGRPGLDPGTLGLKEGSDQYLRSSDVEKVLNKGKTRLLTSASYSGIRLVRGIKRGILRKYLDLNIKAGARSAGRLHSTLTLGDSHGSKARPVEASSLDHPNKSANEYDAAHLASSTTPKLLITINEAANALSISRSKMYELLNSGAIHSVHIGRSRRIRVHDLKEYARRIQERLG